jgi:lipoyl(octanoyl) transferase
MQRDWPTTSAPRSDSGAPRSDSGAPRSDSGAPPLWVVSWESRQPYRRAWDLQRRLWRARWRGGIPDTLLFLEHDPVVTLGRNAHLENVLLPEAELARRGVELVEVDRGGDVTYHGPGQLIGYWIFDLRSWHMDVHRYLREIEEVLIATLRDFGIAAGRSAGATGVWASDAKVAAIGLHLSHWVSTHGFALNLDLDLKPFSWIVPCGLTGRPVTSIAALSGTAPERAQVERLVMNHASRGFGRTPIRLSSDQLEAELSRVEARESAESSKKENPTSRNDSLEGRMGASCQ